MWPTFYIPGICRLTTPPPGDPDCWDYLIPSGTESRIPADGDLNDADITFTATAGRTYRLIGRLSWTHSSGLLRGADIRAAWDFTNAPAAVMHRSQVVRQPELTNDDQAIYSDQTNPWNDVLGTIETVRNISQYPDGDTRTFYTNAVVDLFIVAGEVDTVVSLKWGVSSSNANGTATLNTTGLLTVREYLPT